MHTTKNAPNKNIITQQASSNKSSLTHPKFLESPKCESQSEKMEKKKKKKVETRSLICNTFRVRECVEAL
jgi:hypothetical protein